MNRPAFRRLDRVGAASGGELRPGPLSAQTGTIMGSVNDARSQAALPGAGLILEGTADTAFPGTTDGSC